MTVWALNWLRLLLLQLLLLRHVRKGLDLAELGRGTSSIMGRREHMGCRVLVHGRLACGTFKVLPCAWMPIGSRRVVVWSVFTVQTLLTVLPFCILAKCLKVMERESCPSAEVTLLRPCLNGAFDMILTYDNCVERCDSEPSSAQYNRSQRCP